MASGVQLARDYIQVVGALRCVKWHDLLFPEPGPSSIFVAGVNDDREYTVVRNLRMVRMAVMMMEGLRLLRR